MRTTPNTPHALLALNYLLYLLQSLCHLNPASLVGVLPRFYYPQIFLPFLLTLALLTLLQLSLLLEEMRLKTLPLRIALLLHVEGERDELKRILLCCQVKSLHVVIESLLVRDVPVELEVVVKLKLVGRVRSHSPHRQLALEGTLAKLFRLGIAGQLQKTIFCELFYHLQLVLFLLLRPLQQKSLPAFLFDFLNLGIAFENLYELVVSALLPAEIGLHVIFADVPPEPVFERVLDEDTVVSLADEGTIGAVAAVETAVVVEQRQEKAEI